MAYTPQLSMKSSCTLRRIALALDMHTTKTIEKVFEYLPEIMDKKGRDAGIKVNAMNACLANSTRMRK